MPTITTSVLTEKGETMRLIDADALVKALQDDIEGLEEGMGRR